MCFFCNFFAFEYFWLKRKKRLFQLFDQQRIGSFYIWEPSSEHFDQNRLVWNLELSFPVRTRYQMVSWVGMYWAHESKNCNCFVWSPEESWLARYEHLLNLSRSISSVKPVMGFSSRLSLHAAALLGVWLYVVLMQMTHMVTLNHWRLGRGQML